MEAATEPKPWETLRELLEAGREQALVEYLDTLSGDDTVRALFRLSNEEQAQLMRCLPLEAAAELLEEVPDTHAADILDDLTPKEAASIVAEFDSDQAADVLGELDDEDLEDILEEMEPEEAREARRLINYPFDTAGGLMMTEFLAYTGAKRVREVIHDLSVRDEDVPLYLLQQIYVVRPSGRLRGVVNLNDIAFADPQRQLAGLIREADCAHVASSLDELEEFFEAHDQVVAPVIDDDNRLLGLLRRRAVYDAIAEKADEDAMKMQGIVSGEELRSMPVSQRARRRLSWLSVNIVLNIIAAGVIAAYEDTLTAVIALAVFLPIVSDMSGCSGNQAVAVSMRELTLGIVRPADVFRVWRKEALVGLINGLALGTLIGLAAWLWKGNIWLSGVIGVALALNTVVAVSIGGTVPLILKKLRADPAVASGPVLTTVTDMCGFFLVLSLASLVLPRLG